MYHPYDRFRSTTVATPHSRTQFGSGVPNNTRCPREQTLSSNVPAVQGSSSGRTERERSYRRKERPSRSSTPAWKTYTGSLTTFLQGEGWAMNDRFQATVVTDGQDRHRVSVGYDPYVIADQGGAQNYTEIFQNENMRDATTHEFAPDYQPALSVDSAALEWKSHVQRRRQERRKGLSGGFLHGRIVHLPTQGFADNTINENVPGPLNWQTENTQLLRDLANGSTWQHNPMDMEVPNNQWPRHFTLDHRDLDTNTFKWPQHATSFCPGSSHWQQTGNWSPSNICRYDTSEIHNNTSHWRPSFDHTMSESSSRVEQLGQSGPIDITTTTPADILSGAWCAQPREETLSATEPQNAGPSSTYVNFRKMLNGGQCPETSGSTSFNAEPSSVGHITNDVWDPIFPYEGQLARPRASFPCPTTEQQSFDLATEGLGTFDSLGNTNNEGIWDQLLLASLETFPAPDYTPEPPFPTYLF